MLNYFLAEENCSQIVQRPPLGGFVCHWNRLSSQGSVYWVQAPSILPPGWWPILNCKNRYCVIHLSFLEDFKKCSFKKYSMVLMWTDHFPYYPHQTVVSFLKFYIAPQTAQIAFKDAVQWFFRLNHKSVVINKIDKKIGLSLIGMLPFHHIAWFYLANYSIPKAYTQWIHVCRKYHVWILEPSRQGYIGSHGILSFWWVIISWV